MKSKRLKKREKKQVSFPAFHLLCFPAGYKTVSVSENEYQEGGKEKDEEGRTGKRMQEKWCDEWEDKMKKEEMKKTRDDEGRRLGEG